MMRCILLGDEVLNDNPTVEKTALCNCFRVLFNIILKNTNMSVLIAIIYDNVFDTKIISFLQLISSSHFLIHR